MSLGVAVLASCSATSASATDTLESLLSTYSRLMLETQLALVADRQAADDDSGRQRLCTR